MQNLERKREKEREGEREGTKKFGSEKYAYNSAVPSLRERLRLVNDDENVAYNP